MVLNTKNSNPATNAFNDLVSMQNQQKRKGKGAKHAETLLSIIKQSQQQGHAFNIKSVQDEFYHQSPDLNQGSRRVVFSRAIENILATGELVRIGNDGLYMLPPDGFDIEGNF